MILFKNRKLKNKLKEYKKEEANLENMLRNLFSIQKEYEENRHFLPESSITPIKELMEETELKIQSVYQKLYFEGELFQELMKEIENIYTKRRELIKHKSRNDIDNDLFFNNFLKLLKTNNHENKKNFDNYLISIYKNFEHFFGFDLKQLPYLFIMEMDKYFAHFEDIEDELLKSLISKSRYLFFQHTKQTFYTVVKVYTTKLIRFHNLEKENQHFNSLFNSFIQSQKELAVIKDKMDKQKFILSKLKSNKLNTIYENFCFLYERKLGIINQQKRDIENFLNENLLFHISQNKVLDGKTNGYYRFISNKALVLKNLIDIYHSK